MKKLLALLGAFSLTSTAAAGVVGCTVNLEKLPVDQQLFAQYSKALFLSEQEIQGKHVSANYIFNDLLGNTSLKNLGLSNLADKEGVAATKTFGSISEKYIDTKNITSNTKVSEDIYQDGVITLDSTVDPTLQSILSYLPMVFDLMKNPVDALKMLESVVDLESLVSGDILKQLAGSLTPENMKLLENAFSNDVYGEMDFYSAVNSSIIGLHNAIDLLINQENSKPYDYSDEDTIQKTIYEVTTNLGININGLITGEKSMSFDMSKDIPAIAEIIRFVRTMLVYLNTYSVEEMTSDLLTYDEVKAKRQVKLSTVENKVDIKKLVDVLSILANDKDGKGSFAIRNIVGALFLTTDNDNGRELSSGKFVQMDNDIGLLNDSVEADPDNTSGQYFEGGGYVSILTNIVMQMLGGEKYTVTADGNAYYRPVLRTLVNAGVLGKAGALKNAGKVSTVMDAIPGLAETMPEFLGNAIKAIEDNGDIEAFKNDWILYLWDNDNKKLNFTLKGFMSEPLSGVMSLFGSSESKGFEYVTSGSFDFLLNNSLQDIVNSLSDGLADYETATINFDDFAQLIELCAKDDVLKKALTDISNWLEILGFVDDKIVDGSVIAKLVEIINNLDWLKGVASGINDLVKDYQKDLNNIKTEVLEKFEKLSLKVNSVKGDVYTFTVSEGNDSKTYEIHVKETDGKSVISEIS